MKTEKISHLDVNITHHLSDKNCIERRRPLPDRSGPNGYLQEYGKIAN